MEIVSIDVGWSIVTFSVHAQSYEVKCLTSYKLDTLSNGLIVQINEISKYQLFFFSFFLDLPWEGTL